MPVELAGITLQHLTEVSVRECARIVHHAVPGMSGDLAQTLGRPSVEISFNGIFYGEKAVEDLNQLRSAYLENQPVDFFTETVGDGYFTQVLISRLEVFQHAEYPNQFNFTCDLVEYVKPPEPIAKDPLAAVDSGLVEEATAHIDDIQNAADQVDQLTDLFAKAPTFGDPTKKLQEMPDEYVKLINNKDGTNKDGTTILTGIRDLF